MNERREWGCPTCGDKGVAVNPFKSKCSVCDSWRMHLATGNPTAEQHPADECPERRGTPCPTCLAHQKAVDEAVAVERERCAGIAETLEVNWKDGIEENIQRIATAIRTVEPSTPLEKKEGGQHGK